MFVCAHTRGTYLPAAVIGWMVEGGDAVEEAGQLLLCRVSFSALQQVWNHHEGHSTHGTQTQKVFFLFADATNYFGCFTKNNKKIPLAGAVHASIIVTRDTRLAREAAISY